MVARPFCRRYFNSYVGRKDRRDFLAEIRGRKDAEWPPRDYRSPSVCFRCNTEYYANIIWLINSSMHIEEIVYVVVLLTFRYTYASLLELQASIDCASCLTSLLLNLSSRLFKERQS